MLLEAEGIATDRRLRKLDLSLRRGEIVGLGGLLGSGRTEAARALFGVDALSAGTITMLGAEGAPESPPQRSRPGSAI